MKRTLVEAAMCAALGATTVAILFACYVYATT